MSTDPREEASTKPTPKNWCRGGWSAPTMGGFRRPVTCPTCGKRVTVNRDGRLHAHIYPKGERA